MPYISEADLKRVVQAQRAFLARHEFTHPDAYRLACNRALRELLGADHTVFFEVGGETGDDVLLTSDDTCRGTTDFIEETYRQFRRTSASDLDPHITAFVRRRLRCGTAAVTDLDARPDLERSDVYHDRFVPAGLNFLMGPSVVLGSGEASVLCAFERKTRLYGEEGLRLLELVLPAFRTGAETHLRRPEGHPEGHGLEAFVERLPLPLIVFGPEAADWRNAAFDRLEAAEPESGRLLSAAKNLAKDLAEDPAPSSGAGESLQRRCQVVTAAGSYELVALPQGSSDERVLLLVTRTRLHLPGPRQLMARYALTARQAQVALLLAEGLTDKQVAARLGVSVNTARRHAEGLLRKLGVKTRGAVAFKLLS